VKKRPVEVAFERYSQQHRRCLGLIVRDLRALRRMSQTQIAKRAGVSVRWIQRLEDNELNSNYSICRLDRIASALGVELFELYEHVDEMIGPAPWLRRKKIYKSL
jgi:transcriptional regulator with XRE-family HTH domain